MMSWFIRNEDWHTYIRRYRITSLLLAINILVFLWMTIMGGTTYTSVLIQYGAYYREAILQGEFYRLFTPIFLHSGWEHLLFNCFAILIFAPGLEIILGKLRYLLLYIGTGLAGFIATFLFSSADVAVGASGAIFGIYGMYAYLSRYRKDIMDRNSRQIIMPILIFGIIGTFVFPSVSITGHLGGLVGGYLMGMVLIRK